MIFTRILFTLKPGTKDRFLESTKRYAEKATRDSGIRSIRAASDLESDSAVALLILWDSWTDYETRRKTAIIATWHAETDEYLEKPVDREFFEIIDGFFGEESPW